MYRVVRYFEDLQDNSHPYSAGDKFPREGLIVSNERINELVSDNNKQHTQLIEYVDEEEAPVEEPITSHPEAMETFDEDSLSDMTTKEIIALAERRGYKITKLRKNDVIRQFLKQQG